MEYLKKGKPIEMYLTISAFLFMGVSFSALFLNNDVVIDLAKEDGFFEWLDFLFCLVSAFIFLSIFTKIKLVEKRCNYVYLFLGLLFLFGAGEEISWGQRMFGWALPDFIKNNNMQGELTVHNLAILRRHTANRLFLIFSIFYCLCIPFLDIFSNSFHKKAVKYNIPVAPVFVGLFFPVNYGVSKFFELYETGPFAGLHFSIMEIKECNFLFLWFLIGLFFLTKDFKGKNSGGAFKTSHVLLVP